jgi:DNA-directed RNA polymerase subunit F
MPSTQILSEKPITMAQVKEELERIKKRDKELSYRSLRTDEYLNLFVHKNSQKLYENLKKLDIPRLKEEHITKIVDLMPYNQDDLKNILQAYTLTLTKESIAKIIEEVEKHR